MENQQLQQGVGYQFNPRLLLNSVSNRLGLAGVFWIIASLIQLAAGTLFAIFMLSRINWEHASTIIAVLLAFVTIAVPLVIVASTVAITVSIFSFRKKINKTPIGIIRRFEPLGGKVFLLFFGFLTGIFGLVGAIINISYQSSIKNIDTSTLSCYN